LRAVRNRIAYGWAHHADARDVFGNEVDVDSGEARSWTLCSAFALAGKDGIPMGDLPRALRALADITGMDSLEDWNDETGRTKREVLDALDEAIAHVEVVDALRRGPGGP
jgi:hypothetical protein